MLFSVGCTKIRGNMDLQHGTWGKRYRIWETPTELHTILHLKKNKRCSWHKHIHAHNLFFVISGELTVKTDIGPERQYVTIMPGGIPFVVKPGVLHEFRTGDVDTIIYEIAYVKYDLDDIHREQLGGDIGMINESTR